MSKDKGTEKKHFKLEKKKYLRYVEKEEKTISFIFRKQQ